MSWCRANGVPQNLISPFIKALAVVDDKQYVKGLLDAGVSPYHELKLALQLGSGKCKDLPL